MASSLYFLILGKSQNENKPKSDDGGNQERGTYKYDPAECL